MREESLRLLEGKDTLYCGAARKGMLLYAEIPKTDTRVQTALNSLDRYVDAVFGVKGENVPIATDYFLAAVDICCMLDRGKKPDAIPRILKRARH